MHLLNMPKLNHHLQAYNPAKQQHTVVNSIKRTDFLSVFKGVIHTKMKILLIYLHSCHPKCILYDLLSLV